MFLLVVIQYHTLNYYGKVCVHLYYPKRDGCYIFTVHYFLKVVFT